MLDASPPHDWLDGAPRRREGRSLTPIVNGDGVHFYRAEQVQELTVRRIPGRAPSDYDGELAAKMFDLLDEGLDSVDIVRRLRVDPRAVEALTSKWISLRGGFFVTREEAASLEKAADYLGSGPIRNLESIRAHFELMFECTVCSICRKSASEACMTCTKLISVKEAERRDAASSLRRRQAQVEMTSAESTQELERTLRDKARASPRCRAEGGGAVRRVGTSPTPEPARRTPESRPAAPPSGSVPIAGPSPEVKGRVERVNQVVARRPNVVIRLGR